MAVVLGGAVKLYYYLNEEIADRRTENWPLMRTPWPGLAIIAVYLMAVTKWIPNYMKHRPAYELKSIMAAYNAVQIAACLYVTYYSLTLGWLRHYSFICQPLEDGPDAIEYAWKVCYGYFVIKMVDLLDTVFFTLRKKQNQVTFLHVYHHFGMVIVSWGIVKWVPGGHMSLVVPVNSLVHVIMYSYYLLSICDESYKTSVWWKKHVTQLQILQFGLMLFHYTALAVIKECNYPREPAYLMVPQNLFIFILFLDFYYKAYVRKNNKTI